MPRLKTNAEEMGRKGGGDKAFHYCVEYSPPPLPEENRGREEEGK
jgi:hypothetical protein